MYWGGSSHETVREYTQRTYSCVRVLTESLLLRTFSKRNRYSKKKGFISWTVWIVFRESRSSSSISRRFSNASILHTQYFFSLFFSQVVVAAVVIAPAEQWDCHSSPGCHSDGAAEVRPHYRPTIPRGTQQSPPPLLTSQQRNGGGRLVGCLGRRRCRKQGRVRVHTYSLGANILRIQSWL